MIESSLFLAIRDALAKGVMPEEIIEDDGVYEAVNSLLNFLSKDQVSKQPPIEDRQL
jgi:hypothetical protein